MSLIATVIDTTAHGGRSNEAARRVRTPETTPAARWRFQPAGAWMPALKPDPEIAFLCSMRLGEVRGDSIGAPHAAPGGAA
jgi:hypothetical protein